MTTATTANPATETPAPPTTFEKALRAAHALFATRNAHAFLNTFNLPPVPLDGNDPAIKGYLVGAHTTILTADHTATLEELDNRIRELETEAANLKTSHARQKRYDEIKELKAARNGYPEAAINEYRSLREFCEDAIRRRVESALTAYAEAAEHLTKKTRHPAGLANALEWLDGPAKQILIAELADRVKGDAEEHGWIPAYLHHARRAQRDLQRDAHSGRSTSHFHNATDAARRAAHSDFVDSFGLNLDMVARYETEI